MRAKNPFMSRRRQLGYTLIEVLMSVGLGSLILASGTKFLMDRVDDVKDQSTAQYQSMFVEASERYLRNNFSTIAAGLTQNGPPVAIDLPTIRAAGFAHSGLTNMNPYRQIPCLVVRRLGDSATGPRLEALVTTEGGLSIPERRVPFVAAQSGAIGGFVPSTAPTTAQGAYGVWQTSITPYTSTSCSGTPVAANRLASGMFFDVSSIGGVDRNEVLHRVAVAGRPDLNTMNTNLNMGGWSIHNANEVTASGFVRGGFVQATEGAHLAQTTLARWGLHGEGDIGIHPGQNTALHLMDNVGGTNFEFHNHARLTQNLYGQSQFSRTGAAPCCGPGADSTISVSEVTGGPSGTGREAGINFHNGWIGEGNLVLADTAARGGTRRLLAFESSGDSMGLSIQATGFFITHRAMYADVYHDYYDNNFYVQPRGMSRLNTISMPHGASILGDGVLHINANNNRLYLQPWGTGDTYVGGGGNPGVINFADAIVRNKHGTRYLSDMMPNWVHKGTFVMSHGNTITKPTCNSGGVPRIVVIAQMQSQPEEAYFGAGAHQASRLVARAYDYGSYWGVEIGDWYWWGNGGYGFWAGSGLAMIACWYS